MDDTTTFGPLMFGNDLVRRRIPLVVDVPCQSSDCESFADCSSASRGASSSRRRLQVHRRGGGIRCDLVPPTSRRSSWTDFTFAGMNYEGIYRKTGGSGQTKLITACFERGQDFNLEDTDKYNDLAAVTSCMKNFFRSLPDPLFTHDRHETFVACAGAHIYHRLGPRRRTDHGTRRLQKCQKARDASWRSSKLFIVSRRCTSRRRGCCLDICTGAARHQFWFLALLLTPS